VPDTVRMGHHGRAAAVVATVLAGLAALSSAGRAGAPEAAAGPTALFFGDSLVNGTGSVPRRPVEVRSVADRMGWHAYVDGYGGTGYTTGGVHGRTYLDRLRHDHAMSRTYDVVILEGGTNDARHGSLTHLHNAAVSTVSLVRSRQPHARIVMVGGYAPPGIDTTRYAAADAILAGVAEELDVQYVSQLGFSTTDEPGFLSADRFHPSDHGYDVMGRALAAALVKEA
jgi:lysophospholipase L1-like esterase